MRKGYSPAMMVDTKNRLFCIATGADATSEHECGIDELMLETTGRKPLKAAEVAALLRSGQLQAIPDILENRQILADNPYLVYDERVEKGEPVAVLAYSARGLVKPFESPNISAELNFPAFSKTGQDQAAAWDSAGFAFKVRGGQKVAQLREFAQAMKEGKVAYGGKFMAEVEPLRLSGVIFVRMDLLQPEHREGMKKAQADFESSVKLQLKARTEELRQLMSELKIKCIAHLWPVWKDSVVDGEVAYALNPGQGVDATYWGPYRFEQLCDWLKAGATAPLRPEPGVNSMAQAV